MFQLNVVQWIMVRVSNNIQWVMPVNDIETTRTTLAPGSTVSVKSRQMGGGFVSLVFLCCRWRHHIRAPASLVLTVVFSGRAAATPIMMITVLPTMALKKSIVKGDKAAIAT
jgi:hypothetical protein